MEMLDDGTIPAARGKPPATPPKPRVQSGIPPAPPAHVGVAARQPLWHVSADITEAFAPVVWADLDVRLRRRGPPRC